MRIATVASTVLLTMLCACNRIEYAPARQGASGERLVVVKRELQASSSGFRLLGILPVAFPDVAAAERSIMEQAGVDPHAPDYVLINEVRQTGVVYFFVASIHTMTITADVARLESGPGAPLKLEEAVKKVSDDLFQQVTARRGAGDEARPVKFVTDPVIDADTGEVSNVSQRIEGLMQADAKVKSPGFTLSEMDSRNIDGADYVISGIIPLEHRGKEVGKLRHLSLSAMDRKTGEIVGHSDAWVGNSNLDFSLTPMYADSPMYIKDARVEALIATAKATAGSLADKEYFDSLATNALLGEASRTYDDKNYLLALGLFAKAADREDGKVMKTFAGLYQSFFKLKRSAEAGQAFATLAELGMRSGNLSVKFLFNVNATEFFGTPEVLEEYKIWLRQIAGNILASKMCVQIIGHASRSGSAELNQELSLRRANLVRDRLQAEAPGVDSKTIAMGKGFTENIIGTGANDASDAIDRRVEFRMNQCSS